MMPSVFILGLNPAWQRILRVPLLNLGEVNRAAQSWSLASGKGINAAKILKKLHQEVYLIQILGGETGKKIKLACGNLGIQTSNFNIKSESRTCTTLLHGHTVTEIIEPDFVWSPLGRNLKYPSSSFINQGAFGLISGTRPRGCPAVVYEKILKRIKPQFLMLDAFSALPSGIWNQADAVKINRKELECLRQENPGLFYSRRAPRLWLITNGGEKAYLFLREKGNWLVRKFSVPKPPALVNSIGAGDAVSAAWINFLSKNRDDFIESARKALAVGSATCSRIVPGEFSKAEYSRLLKKTSVNRVPGKFSDLAGAVDSIFKTQ